MTAYVSAFELFSIGVGPSSSHTVGPMRAARDFADRLAASGDLARVAHLHCQLFGSLGATGIGHGTPDAIVVGLAGAAPETVDPAAVREAWSGWVDGTPLLLAGSRPVPFAREDISFHPFTRKEAHPNAMTLIASDGSGAVVSEETYYSIGGGFIRREGDPPEQSEALRHPLPYSTAAELLELCDEHGVSFCDVARYNEVAVHGEAGIDAGLDAIWAAMAECVEHGSAPGQCVSAH